MVLLIHPLQLPPGRSNSTFRAVCCEMPDADPVVLLCEPPNNIGLGVYAGLEDLVRQLDVLHGVDKASAWYGVHQNYERELAHVARDGALVFPIGFPKGYGPGHSSWGRLTNLDAVAQKHGLDATLLKGACLVEPQPACPR